MFPVQKEVQLTVVGKVFRPNKQKALALNSCLNEYLGSVKCYLLLNDVSKTYLHRNWYGYARENFELSSALIQTARDKAVETLKSFRKNGKKNSVLRLRRISLRFDKRCYRFSKTTNVLSPYWLILTLNRKRVSFPIFFGEYQEQIIEQALRREWSFATVEMVKRRGKWYAHFVLKKTVTFADEPQTIIGIDIGEVNLVTAVALTNKPSKGQFWRGSEIERIRGLYNHIRRKLGEKKLVKKIESIGGKEKRKVNQQLHTLASQVIKYVNQFPEPMIAMEDLNGLREHMNFSRKMNRRVHSMPYRKLQTYIQYKANLEGIEVKYVKAKARSKACHRCGRATRKLNGRSFKCPSCGLIYNRDLNGAVNIAQFLERELRWGRREPPEPTNERISEKPTLNVGSPCEGWGSSHKSVSR
jgi:putative transposase